MSGFFCDSRGTGTKLKGAGPAVPGGFEGIKAAKRGGYAISSYVK